MVERIREEGIIKGIVVGISRAGSEEPMVKADYVDRLHKYDFGQSLQSMVFPGGLHFLEAEALIKLAGAPPEIINEVL
jgi:diphthine synthase